MSETVINVDSLSKAYRLGVINHGMLYKDIQSWWARKRGKEDPHSKLDMYNREQLDGEDRFWALKDINLEVKQGDRIGIIGKNGAGKSTLLKILSRVTAPTSGSVKVKGRIASLLEVGTGFHPELTGRENIYLNGAILGMTKTEISRKFEEIVDFAGIGKFIDTPVKRYSSGMYVRLAFAVAAHLEPEILVVDEVLSVGDAEFQKKALGKMEDVSKGEGRTILFVSHNMAAVQTLCTSGVLLGEGGLVNNSSIEEIMHQYNSMLGDINLIKKNNIKGLKILAIRHRPADGKDYYTSESKLIAEFEFITDYIIETAFLNLVIEDYENKFMIHSRTDLLNLYPSFEIGFYNVITEISRLSLKTGTYSLWFRIYTKNKDKTEFADSEKVSIVVKGEQVGGVVNVPVRWEWRKKIGEIF